MITADQPPNGVALRIDRVLEQLKRWDYPVQLVRLKPEPEPKPPPPPPDAITVEEMDEIYYAVKMANVRSGPGSTFNKVARLSVGDEVEVTGKVKEKEWLRIALKDGKKAFVYAPLLSPEKPESIEPEVTPPVEPWSDPNPGPIPPGSV